MIITDLSLFFNLTLKWLYSTQPMLTHVALCTTHQMASNSKTLNPALIANSLSSFQSCHEWVFLPHSNFKNWGGGCMCGWVTDCFLQSGVQWNTYQREYQERLWARLVSSGTFTMKNSKPLESHQSFSFVCFPIVLNFVIKHSSKLWFWKWQFPVALNGLVIWHHAVTV